ncbi:Pc22g10670 [Penicillium rubens Wisconsin 54-1255]|uniref:Pc22g10670 protein n=1 Tax=Penicillium rubens (strain ATCC 28089 / DSM 1075 / NRRL 1951 / Wisconsin 54-1255) TaxID=500485 RepID=B6HVX7_PENRW|nr:Pc22g10670 [Penicillium rubens Wisconsin 54-1255]
MTMQSAALLEREVSDLRGENEKKKQKRARSGKHLYAESGLSVQEASVLITQPVEAAEPGPGQHGWPLACGGHSLVKYVIKVL